MNVPALPTVVIAGGGTAGWVAAAAIAKLLRGLVRVTLVESDEIGTVGVGESTIPTIHTFHRLLEIDEREFVAATDASFKLGIAFEGWRTAASSYFHPFGLIGRSVFMADFQHFWLEAAKRGFGGDYNDYSLETHAAAEGKFATDAEPALSYAYHLDATAYARFLRSVAEAAGAVRIEGRIEQIEQSEESGNIISLQLQSGERVAGDFFIDCTGFRSLLIGQTLGVEFDDWSKWLPCDMALAVQSALTGTPVPFTRAIAHADGWRWRIPLQSRVGNGIVFASRTLSSDEARARLVADMDGVPLFEPRLLRFKTGRRRETWSRNCLALGLAAGFIEPLESTSIHLIMTSVTRLVQAFPFAGVTPAVRDRFNEQARLEWEHVRDFIILHYYLTERRERFWQDCAAMCIPDDLRQRIAVFQERASAWQGHDEIFRVESWVTVMLGQGIRPAAHHPLPSLLSDAELGNSLKALRGRVVETSNKLPPLQLFLARQRANQT